jgi:hypothetical protein
MCEKKRTTDTECSGLLPHTAHCAHTLRDVAVCRVHVLHYSAVMETGEPQGPGLNPVAGYHDYKLR